ncbi:unnamed protein product [Spirodela intermedia]|uniref:Uncharacterized protein n=1 Tax=Spirodela intermedia TaxID=51605 RepID=A0A7I8J8J7_SPIIN|nr:unnamed protein product [Spirodela intermedia]CAA6666497.1 unnamed protein product [Spirodela intermedia]
MIYKYIYIYHC